MSATFWIRLVEQFRQRVLGHKPKNEALAKAEEKPEEQRIRIARTDQLLQQHHEAIRAEIEERRMRLQTVRIRPSPKISRILPPSRS